MKKLVIFLAALLSSFIITLIFPVAESTALAPPTFSISSHSFTYDGERHTVGFDSLEHPRLAEGTLSLEWYRDGELVSVSGSGVSVRDVADSGSYTCRMTFTLGGESVSVETPSFEITVRRAELDIPTAEPAVYTGMPQLARLYSTSLYSVVNEPHTDAGEYSVRLILTDPQNYKWRGVDSTDASTPFVIKPAENFWVDEPRVPDYYAGEAASPIGSSAFGEVEFLYSESEGGVYSDVAPSRAGGYYFIARATGSANYSGVATSPQRFYVIEDMPLGMRIETPPKRSEYLAFDEFLPDGLSALVTYSSGRTERLDAGRLGFEYIGGGDCLRYGDSAVYITYLDLRVLQPVSVEKREYDLSGLAFSDCSLVYSGEHLTLPSPQRLPVGLDGITLTASVVGGGVGVGSYPVSLVFSTESRDYKTPAPMSAVLNITPLSVTVEWERELFVYDGTAKQPRAFFTDERGVRCELSVSGGAVFSGTGYLAIAASPSDNYSLIGERTEFDIAKACYDTSSIVWVGGGYVYDGSVKEVSLAGLPAGVTVIGYTDNRATNAGTYRARAVLNYDSRNYEPPSIPECLWEIARADYDTSGVTLEGGEFIYDGREHLPSIIGRMPIGADGIALGYELSRGATNVSDGRVTVELRFVTDSPNYNTPSPIYATVTVLPREITVAWRDLLVRYDGELHEPSASARECAITVSGSGTNAGEYEVYAASGDTNYTVANYKELLVIEKAENRFLSPVTVGDIFEGRDPSPSAEAFFGAPKFRYFTDIECKSEASLPLAAGEYYLIAEVCESENYLALSSEPIRFSVLAVLPLDMEITLNKNVFTAFERLCAEDIVLRVFCNDGSVYDAPFSELEIDYESSDSLRFGDSGVAVSYHGMMRRAELSVERADYDMSGVLWSELAFVYDACEHRAVLTGLPSGVTVREYIGGIGMKAGSYPVSAILDYDTENYNEPTVPDATLVISKKSVPLPTPEPIVYDMKPHEINLSAEEYYQKSEISVKSLGKHKIEIVLHDPENFTFEGGGDTAFAVVSVVLGRGAKALLYSLLALLLIITVLCVASLLVRRERLQLVLSAIRCRATVAREHFLPSPKPSLPIALPSESRLLSVDVERADTLISDSLARNLIAREEAPIYTDGRRKSIVNVDTLSAHFASGERVDVNALKAKALIPADTAYVKVLARGVIDKPLTVLANDFSLAAVKMIALTGGEARRVVTLRKKENKKK